MKGRVERAYVATCGECEEREIFTACGSLGAARTRAVGRGWAWRSAIGFVCPACAGEPATHDAERAPGLTTAHREILQRAEGRVVDPHSVVLPAGVWHWAYRRGLVSLRHTSVDGWESTRATLQLTDVGRAALAGVTP